MTTGAGAGVLARDDWFHTYRYGFRSVRRVNAQGEAEWEQVPLTLDDVVHPHEGDYVLRNASHARRCHDLYDVFAAQLAGDPSAVVLADTLVAWDRPDMKPHGPDIAVILSVREPKDWSRFDVAEEGVRPALIVEVTSPSTAEADRSRKLTEYALVEVPLYVIVDAVADGQAAAPRLLGYALTAGRLQPVAPDARGRFWLPPVRVWLGVEDDEILCYDETGQPLGDYRTLRTALAAEQRARLAAERRADAEAAGRAAEHLARLDAEARLRALEAELHRLRGE